MGEHGVIFSGPMVRAILEGRKDQTRRVVTPQPWKVGEQYFWHHRTPGAELGGTVIEEDHLCASKAEVAKLVERLSTIEVGDVMLVREAAMLASVGPEPRQVSLKFRADQRADGKMPSRYDIIDHVIPEGAANPFNLLRWTPAIHMPRWATRLRLQVLHVQAERLHELDEADAGREGIFRVEPTPGFYRYAFRDDVIDSYFSPVSAYQALWDGLNGEHGFGWARNPWVRVYTFKVLSGST